MTNRNKQKPPKPVPGCDLFGGVGNIPLTIDDVVHSIEDQERLIKEKTTNCVNSMELIEDSLVNMTLDPRGLNSIPPEFEESMKQLTELGIMMVFCERMKLYLKELKGDVKRNEN